MSLQSTLKKIWYPTGDRQAVPGSAVLILSPAAWIYRCLIAFRNHLYDRNIFAVHHLPCPVISVGNITVGGTGKTPTVIMIAKLLAATGWRPAVLSRGYTGSATSPVNIVSDGEKVMMSSAEAGDEPVLMARTLPGIPVLTGAKRSLTGHAAIERFGVNTLVLDDAYQHRQIHRDINIVLLGGSSPIGNGRLLPAGPLREPISELQRADMAIVTGPAAVDLPEHEDKLTLLKRLMPDGLPVFKGQHKPQLLVQAISGNSTPMSDLQGKRVCAFAGIASPESFRQTVQNQGGIVTTFLAFPDHHSYTDKDIYAIGEAARKDRADFTITTEKDGVKLGRYPDFMRQVHLLQIAMVISGGEVDFDTALLAKLKLWKKN